MLWITILELDDLIVKGRVLFMQCHCLFSLSAFMDMVKLWTTVDD